MNNSFYKVIADADSYRESGFTEDRWVKADMSGNDPIFTISTKEECNSYENMIDSLADFIHHWAYKMMAGDPISEEEITEYTTSRGIV